MALLRERRQRVTAACRVANQWREGLAWSTQHRVLLVWRVVASKSKSIDLLAQVAKLTEAGSELLEGYEVRVLHVPDHVTCRVMDDLYLSYCLGMAFRLKFSHCGRIYSKRMTTSSSRATPNRRRAASRWSTTRRSCSERYSAWKRQQLSKCSRTLVGMLV